MPRHVKFVWGGSRVIKGRWFLGLFGFYDPIKGLREAGLAISVRGLLLWGAAFAVVAYVALAVALFGIWQKNPYSLLSFSDALLYPVRREAILAKKGQAFIAQGLELTRAGKWADGINLLRLGLARYPRDLRARLTLAQFYILTNQRPLGLGVLREGLTAEYPGRPYLETMFKAAEDGEEFDLVAATASRYAGQIRDPALAIDRRWLLERRYYALSSARRYEEALAVAESEETGDTSAEHRVLALLGLGRQAAALDFIAEWRKRPGAHVATAVRLQIRAYREAKRFDEMDRALAEMRAMAPGAPAPLAYAVIQQAMAGREAEAKAALEDYLFRYGGTVDNLMLLASPLAEIAHSRLLRLTAEAAAERGYPRQQFQILQVKTLVQTGGWAEAAAVLKAIPDTGTDGASIRAWREWMDLLIACAQFQSDTAESALVEFLRRRPLQLRVFRTSVEALIMAQRWETARDVIAVAMRGYPGNRWLEEHNATVSAKLAANAAAASASAKPGGPVTPIIERVFVQRLQESVAAGKWDEAAAAIHQVQSIQPAPAWLGAREGMIGLIQVRIAHAKWDHPALLAAGRLFLNGELRRSQELLDFAREVHAKGDAASAVALAREVTRRTPDFPPAQKALNEWQPGGSDTVATTTRSAPVSGAIEGELEQVRARHQQADLPGMLQAARIYLNGDRVRSQQLLAVAQELFSAGDSRAAAMLVREILRRTPNYRVAEQLLAQCEAAEKKR